MFFCVSLCGCIWLMEWWTPRRTAKALPHFAGCFDPDRFICPALYVCLTIRLKKKKGNSILIYQKRSTRPCFSQRPWNVTLDRTWTGEMELNLSLTCRSRVCVFFCFFSECGALENRSNASCLHPCCVPTWKGQEDSNNSKTWAFEEDEYYRDTQQKEKENNGNVL